jgi:glucuronate isomerase
MTVSGRFSSLLDALKARHDAFHAMGCRASDHGLETLWAEPATAAELDTAFDALRAGRVPSPGEALKLKSALLYELARFDHARGWAQQFHLGALRNNNSRMRRTLGPDTGFDPSALRWPALSRFLDRLDDTNQLARPSSQPEPARQRCWRR